MGWGEGAGREVTGGARVATTEAPALRGTVLGGCWILWRTRAGHDPPPEGRPRDAFERRGPDRLFR